MRYLSISESITYSSYCIYFIFSGTHHVQHLYANYALKRIYVTCSFLEGSHNPGFFVIISSPYYSLPTYYAAPREGLTTVVSLQGKFQDAKVIAYDLQSGTGLPEKRAARSVCAKSGVPSYSSTGGDSTTPNREETGESGSVLC